MQMMRYMHGMVTITMGIDWGWSFREVEDRVALGAAEAVGIEDVVLGDHQRDVHNLEFLLQVCIVDLLLFLYCLCLVFFF